jgi:hypothetical protein
MIRAVGGRAADPVCLWGSDRVALTGLAADAKLMRHKIATQMSPEASATERLNG